MITKVVVAGGIEFGKRLSSDMHNYNNIDSHRLRYFKINLADTNQKQPRYEKNADSLYFSGGSALGVPCFLDRKSDNPFISYRFFVQFHDYPHMISISWNENFQPLFSIAYETGALRSNTNINFLYGRTKWTKKTEKHSHVLAVLVGVSLLREIRRGKQITDEEFTEDKKYTLGVPIEILWQSNHHFTILNTGLYALANINKLNSYFAIGFTIFLSIY